MPAMPLRSPVQIRTSSVSEALPPSMKLRPANSRLRGRLTKRWVTRSQGRLLGRLDATISRVTGMYLVMPAVVPRSARSKGWFRASCNPPAVGTAPASSRAKSLPQRRSGTARWSLNAGNAGEAVVAAEAGVAGAGQQPAELPPLGGRRILGRELAGAQPGVDHSYNSGVPSKWRRRRSPASVGAPRLSITAIPSRFPASAVIVITVVDVRRALASI